MFLLILGLFSFFFSLSTPLPPQENFLPKTPCFLGPCFSREQATCRGWVWRGVWRRFAMGRRVLVCPRWASIRDLYLPSWWLFCAGHCYWGEREKRRQNEQKSKSSWGTVFFRDPPEAVSEWVARETLCKSLRKSIRKNGLGWGGGGERTDCFPWVS